MKTATANIGSLIDRIDRGELRLPEIQRSYVWKPTQVAGLIDSLYRRYPSGSLLLWETDAPVRERGVAIGGSGATPIVKPQYLLDGQQRLTSLHRVFHGHERALVVFNIETERFQIESAATRKDARWARVHALLNSGDDAEEADDPEDALVAKLPELPRRAIRARLNRVRAIADYMYYLEVLENLPYEEVTQIFVRVNSRGRPLRATDLALATLSARWPGVIDRFETQVSSCAREGYRHLDFTFLTRCLAALVTETSSSAAFATVSEDKLTDGWQRLQAGLQHLLKLLKGRADIATSTLIPSVNALVPLVVYLGLRDDKPLDAEERNALIYWLFGAWVQARFSGSSETVIAQDVAAVRSAEPIESLYRNLGLLGQRLVVTEAMLSGRGASSPYFLLSYLTARRRKAADWWFGVPVSTSDAGAYSVEYHHIHPRATLRSAYSKAEINDLANLAFISAKANRKISSRSPKDYFPELGAEELEPHCVPTDRSVRTADYYPDFVRERRRLLAEAMSELLDDVRPAFLDTATDVIADLAAGDTLSITAYGSSPDGDDVILVFNARAGGAVWSDTATLVAVEGMLADVSDGRGSAILIGHDEVGIESGAESIDLPMGPLLVSGTLEEWRKVIDREVGEMLPLDELPHVPEPEPWEGERQPFPILDSE
jgi:hypothetical protein